ncbi:uncharacterized protein ATNIH1004_001862 [Aspergillus tanneri]|uniref:Uncharacterized protein n=1 Tax=Aspergillus tanneri TaxID=1220188 RepID=A0A5M9MEH6_9EURO|nr:uncharacterized protein ATNIH1004_001862 [Aspergillus tanneri]KAA8641397.1 hypothetical protein ATNIH1004_001862 [Aspergillus tanneri]
MSAGAVLAQLSVVLAHMESVSSKLSSNIRPSWDQLKEFQNLSVQLEAASERIKKNLEILLRRRAPTEKDINLAEQVRSAKDIRQVMPSLGATLKRNLILLFQGPRLDSALDTSATKARKNQARTRCETLRAQTHHLILLWSIKIQPSAWSSSVGMSDNTFYFLIEELKMEEMSQVPARIVEILEYLKKEEPLKNSMPFENFAKKVAQHKACTDSLKRKHSTETSSYQEGSYKTLREDDSQQQMQLIERSKQIDYKGSSMPISNLPILIDRLPTAIKSSVQWKWERRVFLNNVGGLEGDILDRTDCLNFFVPKDRNHDISITLTVGHEVGLEVIAEVEAIRA